MMHLEHLEQRSRIVWSKFWIQSYTFQWMLLLFLLLLSESIMTIMFLLHQHSAVLQIQVTSKNILYIRHFRFHFLCDSGWFNWAVEISFWNKWWVYWCHQLCSKQGREINIFESTTFNSLKIFTIWAWLGLWQSFFLVPMLWYIVSQWLWFIRVVISAIISQCASNMLFSSKLTGIQKAIVFKVLWLHKKNNVRKYFVLSLQSQQWLLQLVTIIVLFWKYTFIFRE